MSKLNQSHKRTEWYDPDVYAKNSNFQYDWAHQLLDHYSFSGKENVLDIGCGDGKITHEIAQVTKGRVIGIDFSRNLIEFALENHHLPNLNFQVADATELPREFYNQFDLVTSFTCLQWIKDQDIIFQQIARCLKPGGAMLLTFSTDPTPLLNSLKNTIQGVKWCHYFPNWSPYWYYFSENDYDAFMVRADLKKEFMKKLKKPMYFSSRKALHAWINSWNSDQHQIFKAERDEFIESIIDGCDKISNVDGSVVIHWTAIEILANRPVS